jgi:hypothetical protein
LQLGPAPNASAHSAGGTQEPESTGHEERTERTGYLGSLCGNTRTRIGTGHNTHPSRPSQSVPGSGGTPNRRSASPHVRGRGNCNTTRGPSQGARPPPKNSVKAIASYGNRGTAPAIAAAGDDCDTGRCFASARITGLAYVQGTGVSWSRPAGCDRGPIPNEESLVYR